jgi:hypothetical protein
MALDLLRWFVGFFIAGSVVVVLVWGTLLVRAVNREEKEFSERGDPTEEGRDP